MLLDRGSECKIFCTFEMWPDRFARRALEKWTFGQNFNGVGKGGPLLNNNFH